MSFFMVDIEADGPIPGDYSMVSFGAVKVETGLEQTFYGRLRPISEQWVPDALKISGHTREETLTFDDPKEVMEKFDTWVRENNTNHRPILVSDNNGFDFMFVCWYLWHFIGKTPFGHTSQNLGSVYKGMMKDMQPNFKHLRKTKHTHHPVDDAKSNASALLAMKTEMGLKIGLR